MTLPGPVRPRERAVLIDALRGFALFGILIVNIQRYVEDLPGWPNRIVDALIELFAVGKFYPMFAALFGIGFALQLSRARDHHRSVVGVHLRRMASLMAFGILFYLLLDRNDILVSYACAGVPLLLFTAVRRRTLGWAAAVVLVCAVGSVVAIDRFDRTFPDRAATRAATVADETERARVAFTTRPYSALVAVRAEILWRQFGRASFYAAWLHYFGMFLLGWWIERCGVFGDGWRAETRGTATAVVAGGVGLSLAATALFGHRFFGEPWKPGIRAGLGVVSGTLLSVAYGAALARGSRAPAGRRVAGLLARPGRMSLTNFVLQYAIMLMIFHHQGLALYKRIGSAESLILALAIQAALTACSGWWLARFPMGPCEYAWRRLTYART